MIVRSAADHAFIDVDGARLRYRVRGRGPTVVFVHGWALDLDMWEPQFAALADSYRLIAYDRRGFGLSSGTPAIEQDVVDLERLVDALGAGKIAIVGMSQGARIALHWALRFAQRTDAVVLDGPPRNLEGTPGENREEIPIAEFRELVSRAGIEAVRARWLEHPLMRLQSADLRAQDLLQEMVGRYQGRDLMAEESRHVLAVPQLRDLRLPVLVVNGEHDTLDRRSAGAELVRTIRHAERVVVPAAGHLANLDNPRAYNEALRAFLDRHCRGSMARGFGSKVAEEEAK